MIHPPFVPLYTIIHDPTAIDNCTKHNLTHNYRYVIIAVKPKGFRQEGNRWRLAFTLPIQREVMIMTDYEILAIVLLIITLAFSIHNESHRK